MFPPNEPVIGNDPNNHPVGDVPQGGKPNGKAKEPETVTISKAEWESTRRERDEARESERYWAERARHGAAPEPDPEPDPDPGIDTSDLLPQSGNQDVDDAILKDPEKWIDAISKGPQAVQTFLRKQGYVTGKEAADIAAKVARRTVDVERRKISTDSELLTEFPELKDNGQNGRPKSELFIETAKRYQRLVALDPGAQKTPATLFAAAEAAREFLKAKQPPARSRREPDEYNRYEPDDRESRVRAQDGSRRQPESEDYDDAVGPEARELIKQFGLSEDEYVNAAKRTGNGQFRPQGRRR